MRRNYTKENLVLFFTLLILSKSYSQNWQWAKEFNIPFSLPQGLQSSLGTNGSLYVSAYKWDQNYGLPNGSCVIKFDALGNEVWKKTFPEKIRILRLKNDQAGNILICGDFIGKITEDGNIFQSQGNNDGFVMSLDDNGNLNWFKQMPGPGDESVNDIFIHENGDLYLTGQFSKNANLDGNIQSLTGISASYVLKCNSSGNVLKLITSTGADSTACHSGYRIQVDSTGMIYLLGNFNMSVKMDTSTIFGGPPYGEQYFAKFNSQGELQFLKTIATFTDKWKSLSVAQGGAYFTGDGGWTTGGWCKTHKYDLAGNYLWGKMHSGFYYNFSSNKITENNVGFYTVGHEANPNVPQWQTTHSLLLSTFDAAGNENCNRIISKGYVDCYDITRFSSNEYIITGLSPDTIQLGNYMVKKNSGSFFIAKFREDNLVTSLSEQNKRTGNFKVSPNPSSGEFSIEFPEQKNMKICVYDLLGNCILTRAGNSSGNEIIDLSDKVKGIYFVELTSDNRKESRKIILQ